MKFGQSIETFFLRNHTQNVVGKLFPDPFGKNQNRAYLWINSLKCNAVNFCLSSGGITKNIKTKGLTTCFYLT